MNRESSSFQSKSSGRQGITPLIVRQILNCEQHEFKYFGVPIHMVSVVGVIQNVRMDEYQIFCILEDFSGVIEATMCFDSQSEMIQEVDHFVENKYARVLGTIRRDTQKVAFMIIKIFPIDDANIITSHLLQVICARFEAEEELNKQVCTANTTGAALANALVTIDDSIPSTSFTQLTTLQSAILKIVKSENSQYGISRESILRQFPFRQGCEVNEALEHLLNEGLIYSSFDGHHFKSF